MFVQTWFMVSHHMKWYEILSRSSNDTQMGRRSGKVVGYFQIDRQSGSHGVYKGLSGGRTRLVVVPSSGQRRSELMTLSVSVIA